MSLDLSFLDEDTLEDEIDKPNANLDKVDDARIDIAEGRTSGGSVDLSFMDNTESEPVAVEPDVIEPPTPEQNGLPFANAPVRLSDTTQLKNAEKRQNKAAGNIVAEKQSRVNPLPMGQLVQSEAQKLPSPYERGTTMIRDVISGERRLTDLTRGRPELIELLTSMEFGKTTGAIDKTVDIDLSKMTTEEQRDKLVSALAFSTNTGQMVSVIQDVFPGAEIKEDKEGTIHFAIDGKTVLLNRPGWSAQDNEESLFDAVSLMSLNPIAGLYKSAAKRIGTTFMLEAGLDLTKQSLSGKDDLSYTDALITGAFGTLPDLVAWKKARKLNKKIRVQFKEDSRWKNIVGAMKEGSGFGRVTDAVKAGFADTTPAAVLEAELNIIKAKKFETRIGRQMLNPVQEMLNPEDVAAVAGVARNFPNTTMKKLKENFLKDVPETAEQFVKAFSDVNQRTKAPVEVRKAVEKYTADFRKRLSGVSSKIYEGVHKDTTRVNIMPAVQNMMDKLAEAGVTPGDDTWKAIAQSIKGFSGKNTVAGVHTAKVVLGKRISRLNMEISADRHVKSVLSEFSSGVTSILDDVSPVYRKATKQFKSRIVPIRDEFEQSLTAKLASLPYKSKGKIVERMFADGAKNSKQLIKTKKVLDAIDPELFKHALGTHIDNRLAKVNIPELLSTDLKSIAKVPKDIRKALFGTAAEEATMKKVLDPAEKETFEMFKDAFNRLEHGWGSDITTQIKQGLSERSLSNIEKVSLRKKIFTAVTTPALVSTVSPSLGMASAIGSSSRITKGILMDQKEKAALKRLKAFKEMMFNPKYRKELYKIRREGLDNKRGLRSFLKLVTGVEDDAQLEQSSNIGGL